MKPENFVDIPEDQVRYESVLIELKKANELLDGISQMIYFIGIVIIIFGVIFSWLILLH